MNDKDREGGHGMGEGEKKKKRGTKMVEQKCRSARVEV